MRGRHVVKGAVGGASKTRLGWWGSTRRRTLKGKDWWSSNRRPRSTPSNGVRNCETTETCSVAECRFDAHKRRAGVGIKVIGGPRKNRGSVVSSECLLATDALQSPGDILDTSGLLR